VSTTDTRPRVWVGHVALLVPDVARAKSFFLSLGLRDAEPESTVGVLEMRGGTHLLLLPGNRPVDAGTRAPFDLMVDDHVDARARYVSQGFTVSEMQKSPFHEFFTVREPNGYEIVVNSSHATGLPV
jgi:catechol 2,3-dioxygenase-like lactoylglutathione lyase family enzyme